MISQKPRIRYHVDKAIIIYYPDKPVEIIKKDWFSECIIFSIKDKYEIESPNRWDFLKNIFSV